MSYIFVRVVHHNRTHVLPLCLIFPMYSWLIRAWPWLSSTVGTVVSAFFLFLSGLDEAGIWWLIIEFFSFKLYPPQGFDPLSLDAVYKLNDSSVWLIILFTLPFFMENVNYICCFINCHFLGLFSFGRICLERCELVIGVM